MPLRYCRRGQRLCTDSSPDGLGYASGNSERAVTAGRYELSRHSGDTHLYRMAEWAIKRPKTRALQPHDWRLATPPTVKGSSAIEKWRGQSGWLSVTLLSIETPND